MQLSSSNDDDSQKKPDSELSVYEIDRELTQKIRELEHLKEQAKPQSDRTKMIHPDYEKLKENAENVDKTPATRRFITSM